MATTKKTPAKKPATRATKTKATTAKATVAKKPAVVKATTKKTPVKKTAAKKSTAKKTESRSFRVAPSESAFTDFRITRQTVYWIILIAFIVFAQLWILKLQIEVATLLDAQAIELQQF